MHNLIEGSLIFISESLCSVFAVYGVSELKTEPACPIRVLVCETTIHAC